MLLITQIVMTVRFGRKKTRQKVIVISKYALEEFVICCINELSKICVLRRHGAIIPVAGRVINDK